MKDRIRAVLKKNVCLCVDVDVLQDSSDLYRAGLTSQASVILMLAIENEFDIELPDRLLGRAMFESIESIAAAIGTIESVSR